MDEFLVGAERTSVIDHPHRPILGPQKIALVAIAILDELIEETKDVNVAGRSRGVRTPPQVWRQLEAPAFVHRHVVDPPRHRRRLAVHPSNDRHRDVVEIE